ncbi:hypothetical protein [Nonomuraea sp. JJY05]|jgi:hypothetical protein|uniref:hypothetical protein n=1 Tax=Nonomuraea sp. JJY05 TaxID=3350255 RepID=UPI00373FBA18
MTYQSYPLDQPIPAEPLPQDAPPAEAPKATPEGEEDSGGVLDVLEKIGSVVVPAGVTLYALLYMGFKEMYSVFGITPEQAGMDQSVLFGRLLGTLLPLILISALFIGLVIGLGWLLNLITRGWAGRLFQAVRARPWIVAVMAAIWAGLSYLGFLYYVYTAAGEHLGGGEVVFAIALGFLAYVVPFRLLRRRSIGRAGMKVLIGAFTGVGLGYLLIIQMVFGAVQVQETGQANTLLDSLGFQDQWARLQDSSGKTLYDGRWMMLLGEFEGGYAFYDCDKLMTFRKFSESTILVDIQLDPDREKGFTCGTLAEKDKKGS